MALKSFNLEGSRRSGQTLTGNWFEDRAWGSERQNNLDILRASSHGYRLTAQPGYEHKAMRTVYQKAYIPPSEQYDKSMRRSVAVQRGPVIFNVSGNFPAEPSSLPPVKW
jgi:hypothetical protein